MRPFAGLGLLATVTDDGAGFDTTLASHGTGLQGMAGRLAAVGGTLLIHFTPGLGTATPGTTASRATGATKKCLLPLQSPGFRRSVAPVLRARAGRPM